jgi:predicted signal transduction protein with EAL and GGDEF domain
METIEHGVALLSIGCEHAQGYGIAHPMPAEAVPAWIAQWKCPPAGDAPRPPPEHGTQMPGGGT